MRINSSIDILITSALAAHLTPKPDATFIDPHELGGFSAVNPPQDVRRSNHTEGPSEYMVDNFTRQLDVVPPAIPELRVCKLSVPFGRSRPVSDTPRADLLDPCRAVDRPVVHIPSGEPTALAHAIGLDQCA
jgi:hypothetical protein